MKKPLSIWIITIVLCAVSLEGFLSFPNILLTLQTPLQYIVAACHIIYVGMSLGIVYCIWRSLRSTWIVVIIWGIASIGAAVGGPWTFGATSPTIYRTTIAVTLSIVLLTLLLLGYVRQMRRKKI